MLQYAPVSETTSYPAQAGAMRRLSPWFGVLAVAFACSKEHAASSGGPCQKDTDCKTDRICENGQCVSPPRPIVTGSPSVSAGPAPSLAAHSGSERSQVPGGTCAVTSGLKDGTDHVVGTPRVVAAAPELTSRLAVYTAEYATVLAPRGWKCEGTVGVDGSEGIRVSDSSMPGQAVTVSFIPACQGCIAALVCPFFPSVLKSWPEMDCQKPPAKELVMHPNATTAFFEDPPGIKGTGDPSGGPYPANGVVIFNGSAYQATCTLPESDHALCTVVLNDFLHK